MNALKVLTEQTLTIFVHRDLLVVSNFMTHRRHLLHHTGAGMNLMAKAQDTEGPFRGFFLLTRADDLKAGIWSWKGTIHYDVIEGKLAAAVGTWERYDGKAYEAWCKQ